MRVAVRMRQLAIANAFRLLLLLTIVFLHLHRYHSPLCAVFFVVTANVGNCFLSLVRSPFSYFYFHVSLFVCLLLLTRHRCIVASWMWLIHGLAFSRLIARPPTRTASYRASRYIRENHSPIAIWFFCSHPHTHTQSLPTRLDNVGDGGGGGESNKDGKKSSD